MDGPAVAPHDDALWQEWTIDRGSLLHSGVFDAMTREVSYNGALNRLPGKATLIHASDTMYAMARKRHHEAYGYGMAVRH
jgi:hypothetical protein